MDRKLDRPATRITPLSSDERIVGFQARHLPRWPRLVAWKPTRRVVVHQPTTEMPRTQEAKDNYLPRTCLPQPFQTLRFRTIDQGAPWDPWGLPVPTARIPIHVLAPRKDVDRPILQDQARRDHLILRSKASDQTKLDLLMVPQDRLGLMGAGDPLQVKDPQTDPLASMVIIDLHQAGRHRLVALGVAGAALPAIPIENQSHDKPTASLLITSLITIPPTRMAALYLDMIQGQSRPHTTKASDLTVQMETATKIDLVLAC
ncbi:hypothetical protein E5D57_010105 [Metarhizium anisopliae]|nr:hypothetical protein E5D57_010105 [Metarhizium anisopliae]